MVSRCNGHRNQGLEGWAGTEVHEAAPGLTVCCGFTLRVVCFLSSLCRCSSSFPHVYLNMVPLNMEAEAEWEQARSEAVGSYKRILSLQSFRSCRVCENMRLPVGEFIHRLLFCCYLISCSVCV